MTPAERERLRHLARVIRREVRHLSDTARRLFAENLSPDRLARLEDEPELAERIDAFAARFGRLQDTLGGRLLPALLRAMGETPGPALENLDRAERFGWIDSADAWMEARRLRNQLVHDYLEDPALLADALAAARRFLRPLLDAATRMMREMEARGWVEPADGR